MKKVFLVFCFIFPCIHLAAQQFDVDSLIEVALSTKNKELQRSQENRDSLINQFSAIKSIDDRLDLMYKVINNGEDISLDGLSYHYKILTWAKNNKDDKIEAAITAELGYNIYLNGNVEEGTRLCFTALDQAEATGNPRVIGMVYDNLGICFRGKPKISLGYMQKAYRFSKLGNDSLYISYELGNLSNIYATLNQQDSARSYALRALKWSAFNDFRGIDFALMRLADIEPDNQLKIKYLKAAWKFSKKFETISVKPILLNEFTKYFMKQGNTDSAFYYAKKAYDVASGFSISRRLQPAGNLMSLFEGVNTDSTLKYTKIYYQIKDSLNDIKSIEQAQALAFSNQIRQQEIENQRKDYQTNIKYTVLVAVIVLLISLAIVFFRNSQKSKAANQLLQQQKEEIQTTLDKLESTQSQLIQSEKMASLGELTAGIAHEIQNPLNFVNNFSEVSNEMIDEMNEELDKNDVEEARAIAADIKQNLEKINHHGKRADAIVKGMLQHSRSSTGQKEPTDINALCDEYLRLSYHGLRAKDKSFNADFKSDFDEGIGKVNIIAQDIGRVLLNLINNAFYAVDEKKKQEGDGYQPTVAVSTKKLGPSENPLSLGEGRGEAIQITVKDNGNGIPEQIREKIFQPFFTTKPTGQGTGLGLSLSYDIVKAHGGELKVETKIGEGSTFIIQLPTEIIP